MNKQSANMTAKFRKMASTENRMKTTRRNQVQIQRYITKLFCHKFVEICFRRSGKGVKIFAEGCCRPIVLGRLQEISGIMAKISIFFFSILTIAFRVEFNALSSECNALNLAQGFTDLPMPNVLSKHFKELVCFLRCY